MRTLHIALDALTALLFAGSIGIATGILGCAYTYRLDFGAKAAVCGFVLSCAAFGYALWRKYRVRPASSRTATELAYEQLAGVH